MGETTRKRVKETLRRAKEVRIWFWDGQREYNGTAQDISATGFAASFLVTDASKQRSIALRPTLVEILVHQLTTKPLEFRITGMGEELHIKGQVINVDQSHENPDWLLVSGELSPSRETDRATLTRMGESIPRS